MIASVTGTRRGATPYQVRSAAGLFVACQVTELHVGDCIGVDAQMYHMGKAFHCHLVIHPPIYKTYRAFVGDERDTMRPEKGYTARDRDMVDESLVLFGFPKGVAEEFEHSGTWNTIRYARMQNRPIAIVWPNGHISYERWNG